MALLPALLLAVGLLLGPLPVAPFAPRAASCPRRRDRGAVPRAALATATVTLNTPAERAAYAVRAKARLRELLDRMAGSAEEHDRVGILM